MRLQVRILGRELLAVEHDHQPAASPQPEPQAQAEPEIPAGFGFHGGSGGSQQTTWQRTVDRPLDPR